MMTGPNPDSFQRALARFKQSLSRTSPELIDQFSMTGPQDVRRICMEIQDQLGRDGCLRRMRRIESFLEAMDHLGKSIEVFVNANEIVCFIWGPIKFLLGVAKQYLDSFDKLLDIYAKIGEAMPGLMLYQSTFEKHRPLATVLEDYYSDILRFHEAALGVFTRPKWKTTFNSVWKTFDTKFKPILDSLNRRRQLLESEKQSATLYEISRSREENAAFDEERRREAHFEQLEKHKWRLLHVKEKLEAPGYQRDQEMATEDRNGSASGTWVLTNPVFKEWARKDTRGHKAIYLNGIPGAGKTTLVSSIVEVLLKEIHVEDSDCDTLLAYFYFKHNQADKRTHNGFLRALMEQIITRDSALSDHLFDDLASINGVNLRSTKTLEPLVATSFEHFRTCLIIMDGLDEAGEGEAEKLLNWLLPHANEREQDNATAIRLLFSGQRDGIIDYRLSGQPSITLESVSAHDFDISNYCAHMCARIRSKFSISSGMEREIVSQVTSQAKGMFLYARVVLDNLLSQTKLSRLRKEMEPGTFPDGIERAYERVAVRIFQESPRAEREDATKILGWLTCAERLLHWREIQAIFCIDPEASRIDYDGERLRMSCKQLCGSLVDIHHVQNGQDGPDDVIKIVHGTARDYFLRNQWIKLSLEHAKAATFCFRYLTSEPFLRDADDVQILLYAKKGYYALQDYALRYCLDHFLHSIERSPSDTTQMMTETMESARDFLNLYSLSKSTPRSVSNILHEEIIRFIRGFPNNPRDRVGCLDIAHCTISIRRQIEEMRSHALTTEELDIANNLYGLQAVFKCPKLWCSHFTTGFSTTKDRTKHVDCHERPFCCLKDGCFATQIGFDTEEKLGQHMARYHPPPSAELRFPKRSAKRQRIHDAAAAGDVTAVLALLDSGVNPNLQRRSDNSTPITLAAKFGHLEVCKNLLARGAKMFDRTKGASEIMVPAMHFAVHGGSLDIIYLLLHHPDFLCQPEILNAPGVKMLIVNQFICDACLCSNTEALKLLFESPLSRGLKLSTLEPFNRQAMLKACTRGPSFEPLRCLLEHGFSELMTPDTFFRAESQGREDLVCLLRPIIDKTDPPYSVQRAEHLLGYLGLDSSFLSEGQMAMLLNQSPADQRITVKRFETALVKEKEMRSSPALQALRSALQFQDRLFKAEEEEEEEEEGAKMRALAIVLPR